MFINWWCIKHKSAYISFMIKKTMRIKKAEEERGYSFDLEHVRVELFHLLSIFLADEKYAQAIGEDDPLWELASYGEPEVTRLLVNSAVVGRIIDDREGRFLPVDSCHCGELIRDKGTPEPEPLHLREAFNKIIHATEFELVIGGIEDEIEYAYLEPSIILHGHHGKQNWVANLDIIRYAREYVRHINDLDKDANRSGTYYGEDE